MVSYPYTKKKRKEIVKQKWMRKCVHLLLLRVEETKGEEAVPYHPHPHPLSYLFHLLPLHSTPQLLLLPHLSLKKTLTPNPNYSPRSFPYAVKQRCWDKADKVKGRDPKRWRRDSLGNIVFRKLLGCPGCLCHDYDHILPYSKGGESTLENCQVLQATVNRSKGNRTDMSKADLIQKSHYCKVSDRDMDLLEISADSNVQRGIDSGGCRIQ